jgi:hypothetical protein
LRRYLETHGEIDDDRLSEYEEFQELAADYEVPPFGREYVENELRRIADGLSAPRTGYQRSTGFVEMATQSVP